MIIVNKARAKRRKRLRAKLVELLGGKCAEPKCGSTRELEVDHIDGCTWEQKRLNVEHRLYRYLRELREGIRLQLLCRSCNAAKNQCVYGTRANRQIPSDSKEGVCDEVPF